MKKKVLFFILSFFIFNIRTVFAGSTVSVGINSVYKIIGETVNGVPRYIIDVERTGINSPQGSIRNVTIFNQVVPFHNSERDVTVYNSSDNSGTVHLDRANSILIETGPVRALTYSENKTSNICWISPEVVCVNFTVETFAYPRYYLQRYYIEGNYSKSQIYSLFWELPYYVGSGSHWSAAGVYYFNGTYKWAGNTETIHIEQINVSAAFMWNETGYNTSMGFFFTSFPTNTFTNLDWHYKKPAGVYLSHYTSSTSKNYSFGYLALFTDSGNKSLEENYTVWLGFKDQWFDFYYPASVSAINGSYEGRDNVTGTYNFTVANNGFLRFNFSTNGIKHFLPVFHIKDITSNSSFYKDHIWYKNYSKPNPQWEKLTNYTDFVIQDGNSSYFGYNYILLLINKTLGSDYEFWISNESDPAGIFTRKIINWNKTLMIWNDTNATGSAFTLKYYITGLKPNCYYNVYNNSVLTYILKTDSSGSLSFTIYLSGEREIKVQEEEAPQYSNNKTFPTSPTTYEQAKAYQFNITCTDNSGITNAWLTFNNSNYNMNNQSSEFYITLTDLPVGNYYYNFTCNDTFGITNTTPILLYTIEKAKPILTISNSSYSVNTSGLVGYWRFEEGSGNLAKDSSGYGNDGTLYNNPSWTEGMFGNALSFDGSDDYVGVGATDSLNSIGKTNFTVLTWFKINSINNKQRLVSKGSIDWSKGWHTFLWSGGQFGFELSDGIGGGVGDFTTETFNDGKWHFAVVVISISNNFKLYVDGNILKTVDISGEGEVSNTNYNVEIGRQNIGGENFNGKIDEVLIINRTLTTDEIKLLYQSQVTYKTQTNFSCYSNTQQVTPSLYRNTTQVSNPDIQNLTAGYYYYLCNASETQNYTISSILAPLKVNPGSVSLTLSPELTKGIFYTNLTGSTLNIQFNVDVNDWNNATWNYNATSKKTEYWIKNEGTYEVDICQKANSNMVCQDVWCQNYEIYIGNVSWSNSTINNETHPSFSTLYPLTLDYSGNKSAYNLAPGSSIYLRFWFFVPSYVPSGKYNTSIVFKVVEAGNSC